MWSLIYKDLYQQRKNLAFFLLLAAITGYVFRSVADGGPLIVFMLGLTIAFNMTLRSAVEEFKNNGFVFLGSLPLKRPAIVYSKFTGSLVFTVLGYVLALAMNYIFDGMVFTATARQMSLGALLGFCFVVFLQGIFWLLFFLLGYTAALNISRLLFLLPLVFVVLPKDSLGPGQALLSSAGLEEIAVLVGVGTLLVYAVLMVGAVVAFNRSDVI